MLIRLEKVHIIRYWNDEFYDFTEYSGIDYECKTVGISVATWRLTYDIHYFYIDSSKISIYGVNKK